MFKIKRKPDEIINDNYLERWYLVPKNKWCNVYLHKFTGSDMDRYLHDHPWWSVSFLLRGRLFEILQGCRWDTDYMAFVSNSRHIFPYWPYLRAPEHLHRIELLSDEAWTLFITGPKVREWGFHTAEGWKPWTKVGS